MKTVTIKLDAYEARMADLLTAKYRAPNVQQAIRSAFIRECVRYGLDMKALATVLDDAEPTPPPPGSTPQQP